MNSVERVNWLVFIFSLKSPMNNLGVQFYLEPALDNCASSTNRIEYYICDSIYWQPQRLQSTPLFWWCVSAVCGAPLPLLIL